ncbi:hypothetical protein JCM19241_5992 [Vibrio ishigakensis]|uniref:Acetyltransferase n=1 Tax=Vibrio ishigakensis TaxID=1481914 RepID=A0A0B8QER6_9VIBR|nr:hypothetical protein JCM19241_5992 [Vibrio ishigakensis]
MARVEQVKPSYIPMSLLLEADPDEAMILSYLESCLAFVLIEDDKVAGACLLRQESDGNSAELMNIASGLINKSWDSVQCFLREC